MTAGPTPMAGRSAYRSRASASSVTYRARAMRNPPLRVPPTYRTTLAQCPDPRSPGIMDGMTTESRARSFSAAAARYADHRPSYPPELLTALADLAGFPPAGARVADVGAGTGIATALLEAAGARVVAVEPGEGMAAEFRRRNPRTPLVRGDGNRLPLATGSVDLLTYAQSWHWTDPARSVPEALRVLRPGGALAVWSNDPDVSVGWISEQQDRIEERFGPGWYINERARSQGDCASPPAFCRGRAASRSTRIWRSCPRTPCSSSARPARTPSSPTNGPCSWAGSRTAWSRSTTWSI